MKQVRKWMSGSVFAPLPAADRPSLLGVKFSFFKQFMESVCEDSSYWEGLTTLEVLTKVIMPLTKEANLSLCELYQDRDCVGRATWFICHVCRYKFLDLIDSISAFLEIQYVDDLEAASNATFWIDMLSLPQHRSGIIPSFERSVSMVHFLVLHIGNVLMIALPGDNPVTLSRAWCVLEIAVSIYLSSRFEVTMSRSETSRLLEKLRLNNTLDFFQNVIGNHSISEQCQSSSYDDLENIRSKLQAVSVGFSKIDSVVWTAMKKWILQYSRSLSQVVADNSRVAGPDTNQLQGSLQSPSELRSGHDDFRGIQSASPDKDADTLIPTLLPLLPLAYDRSNPAAGIYSPCQTISDAPKTYLNVPWKRAVINLIGASSSGKSTVARSLCGDEAAVSHDTHFSDDVHLRSSFASKRDAGIQALVTKTNLVHCGYTLRVQDFTNEKVLNEIQSIYLRQNVFNIVVFDMSKLLGEAVVEELNCLDGWFRSVAAYSSPSPFAFVGTRSDEVPRDRYSDVLAILKTRFEYSVGWGRAISCAVNKAVCDNILPFFPVNGVIGCQCPGIQHLLSCIVGTLEHTDLTEISVPRTWLRVLEDFENLESTGVDEWKSTSSIAADVYQRFGMSENDLQAMLQAFHDRGEITWSKTQSLESVVIFDALAYLYDPAMSLVCPYFSDGTSSSDHEYCRLHGGDEYELYSRNGIVTEKLLKCLWKDTVSEDRFPQVLHIFSQCGVLIKWRPVDETVSREKDGTPYLYIVPAILPPRDTHLSDRICLGNTDSLTFLIAFSDDKKSSLPNISSATLTRKCYIPSRLFERLVCGLADRNQHVENDFGGRLGRDSVTLIYGLEYQIFRRPNYGCLQVVIKSSSCAEPEPWSIFNRLEQQLKIVLETAFPSVGWKAYIPLKPVRLADAREISMSEAHFIWLDRILQATSHRPPTRGEVVEFNLWAKEISQQYAPWTRKVKVEEYDIFISYRQNITADGELIVDILNIIRVNYIGTENRIVRVFIDTQCIEKGSNFQEVFFNSLLKTAVICPIISPDALRRMQGMDAQSDVDNLLIEWISALMARNYMKEAKTRTRVRCIYPIFLGSVAGNYMQSDIFNEIKRLPSVHPVATVARVKDLLESGGVLVTAAMSKFLEGLTVSSVVKELSSFNGFLVWEHYNSEKDWAATCSTEIMKVAVGCVDSIEQEARAGGEINEVHAIEQQKSMQCQFNEWGLGMYASDFEIHGLDMPTLRLANVDSIADLKSSLGDTELNIYAKPLFLLKLLNGLRNFAGMGPLTLKEASR
jgi:hypothetical protein